MRGEGSDSKKEGKSSVEVLHMTRQTHSSDHHRVRVDAGRGIASEKPRTAVVIVHYGDATPLKLCLASLRRSRGVDVTVLLIDNNVRSDRAAQAALAARQAGAAYYRFPENLGFAAGANAGLRLARLSDPDVMVVVNSDVRLGRNCLATLARTVLAGAFTGIAGPLLLDAAAVRRVWNGGTCVEWPSARPRSLSAGASYRRVRPDDPAGAEVDFVCGAVLALRPSVFERLGGLDEDYFLYYEDADLCFAARRAGLRVVVRSDARAWHRGGASFDGRLPEAIYYRTRNRLLFSARWSPVLVTGWWSRSTTIARVLGRGVGKILTGRRAEGLMLFAAIRDYITGRRGRGPSLVCVGEGGPGT